MDSISVSMDGAPGTQNQNRPLISGKNSSSIVMRNLKVLDENQFTYGIRMTATRPFENLPSNVEFILQETKCRSIQVEPAFNLTRGGHEAGKERDEYLSFSEAFIKAYNIAKNKGVQVRFSAARPGLTTDTFCLAPFNAMAVNPYNLIVTCYEITHPSHPLVGISSFGIVNGHTITFESNPRSKLHALLAERQIQCQSCFCKWSCAGDCYTRAILPGDGGNLIFGERCEMIRNLTRYLILDLMADAGGVWSRSGMGFLNT